MRLFAACLAVCALCATIVAQEAPKGGAAADEGFFVLFKTAGRKWSLKRAPKPGNEGGDVDTSYHYFEIVGVHAEFAELGTSTLTQPGGDPYDSLGVGQVKFDKQDPAFGPGKGFTKTATEKIKCEAGTFDCTRWQDGTGATQWRSTEFPGLLVKWDDRFGTRTLHSFDWIDGDPGYKPPKTKAKGRPAKPDEDPARLFKKRGRTWALKVNNYSGNINKRVKSYELAQHEVAKVNATEAELVVTRMSMTRTKIAGGETKKTIVLADIENLAKPSPTARPVRSEPRRVIDRVYTCKVYEFKDSEGRDVTEWYADEWPGLLVRRQVRGEPLSRMVQFCELYEFAE